MADFSNLTTGLTGTFTMPVTPERLATVVGSGNAPVFASPMMVTTFEAACVACIEHLLPTGFQSLGTHLDVTHTAPTPEGLTVTATATLKAILGRKLTFDVTAHDGKEPIGGGTHTRVIVDTPRFMARVAAKSPSQD
ncbi:MAG TPA: thioesterase family protein [Hyphomicrobium sp.]|nr:thioesterase family protein [Hyphomicrobium sp.]